MMDMQHGNGAAGLASHPANAVGAATPGKAGRQEGLIRLKGTYR